MNRKGITYPALLALVVGAVAAAGLLLNHFYPLSLNRVLPSVKGNRPSFARALLPSGGKAKRAAAVSSPVPAGAKRIPAQLYRQNKQSDTWADVFYGSEKLALLVTAPGCPYRAKYRQDFEWTLGRPEYAGSYRQKIIVTPQSFTVSDNSPYNAQNYLLDNCMGCVCVIEPRKRWIATVNSSNFSDAARLLARYKDD